MGKKNYDNWLDDHGTLHILEINDGEVKCIDEIENYEEIYGPLEDDDGTWLVYPSD